MITVEQLIAQLSKLNPEAKVYIATEHNRPVDVDLENNIRTVRVQRDAFGEDWHKLALKDAPGEEAIFITNFNLYPNVW